MLDDALVSQLRDYLVKITTPIELIAALGADDESQKMRDVLTQVADLSSDITLREDAAGAPRTPAFTVRRSGTAAGECEVTFAGLPLGHEFTSFVLALLQVGGHPSTADADLLAQIAQLEGEHRFETFVSLSCQSCPDVVQALNLMSVLNPNITHTMIDGGTFPDEAEQREILAVPTIFCNGELFNRGRSSLKEIVAKIDTGSGERDAAEISAREPYEVLIIGGGPAGATAAIYAARKGIRTGIFTETFGGQVNDTLAIENFISVPHTEGPALVSAMEGHVREYEVDITENQRAASITDAPDSDGYHTVTFESGATVRGRTVIISTGASWRTLNVDGEEKYRNAGVTFCPHCDGPVFSGKRVAVVGGGNSGVEAAIDLAGIVGHVTLIEYDDVLRADGVLQDRLHSLENVDVIVSAETKEISGDGERVNGLIYRSRGDDGTHNVDLDGVFIQIGLAPNTKWLADVVDCNERTGEVEIDLRGATSVPGVFAAGDCTTMPYKQIISSMGAGSTAALSAFDYLIRTPVPSPS